MAKQDLLVQAFAAIGLVASAAGTLALIKYISARLAESTATRDNNDAPVSRLKARLPLSAFVKLRNDLIIRAALGQKTERTPVWCMRQAGRHMEEFRKVRAKHGFFEVCRNPHLAAEVTLQPLRRYKTIDACIIFSDILVIPQAMGMDVEMVKGKGPVLPQPLKTPDDLGRLDFSPDIEETLGYMLDAINLTRSRLAGQVPLIGFCGAPFSLMCYMIEGGSSTGKPNAKAWLYKFPEASHRLLQGLADVAVAFLIEQQKAGAQLLQLFETVGGCELTREHYREFCLPYLKQIGERVRKELPDTPLILFSRDTPYALAEMSDSAFNVIGLDWKVDRKEARDLCKGKALQGNLDSSALFADVNEIRHQVRRMLQEFGTQKYIANLGHGVLPSHDPKHVKAFVDAVHDISEELNQAA